MRRSPMLRPPYRPIYADIMRTTISRWTLKLAVLAALSVAATPAEAKRGSVADPYDTRGAVMLTGRYNVWSAAVPLPGHPEVLSGSGVALALSTDMYGRVLGFDLGFRLMNNMAPNADGSALSDKSSFTLFEVQPEISYALINSEPFFLGLGGGLNVRTNVLALDESPSRALTNWTSVGAGPSARLRYFFGKSLHVTAAVHVSLLRLAGSWTAAGVSTIGPGGPQAFFRSGDLENLFVANAMVAAAWRPLEFLAITGGLGYRSAGFRVMEREIDGRLKELGAGSESDLQPFAGLELLF